MKKYLESNEGIINSEYKLETISNFEGFVLESWGPKDRNPEYNKALTIILKRLIELKVPYIRLFVVSRNLTKAFPNIEEREIVIDSNLKQKILLNSNNDIDEIRLSIGRKQKELKVNNKTTGGNYTKRILIYNKYITSSLWNNIALGNYKKEDYINQISEPTINLKQLDESVDILINTEMRTPEGSTSPQKENRIVETYTRDPKVKAWVLSNSKGICECCNNSAPFIKENNLPYLEAHHLVPLSENGSDTISNVVAVCPNCHMELHYGKSKLQIKTKIINEIDRLINELESTAANTV